METTFETKEQFIEAVKVWKETTNSERKHTLQCYHFALYRMLKCKDWTKCFSPSESKQKHYPFTSKEYALNMIKSTYMDTVLLAPFDQTVSAEQLNKIREQL